MDERVSERRSGESTAESAIAYGIVWRVLAWQVSMRGKPALPPESPAPLGPPPPKLEHRLPPVMYLGSFCGGTTTAFRVWVGWKGGGDDEALDLDKIGFQVKRM